MRLKRLARLGNPIPRAESTSTEEPSTPPKPVASSSRLEPIQSAKPVPISTPTSSALGKRQQEDTKPVRPRVPYQEWEERRVGEVFATTLDVSAISTRLTSAINSGTFRLAPMLAEGTSG
jgi:hypothetical protein